MHFFSLAAAFGMQLMKGFSNFIDYKSYSVSLGDPAYYVFVLVATVACIAPVEAVRVYARFFAPSSDQQLLQYDL